MCIYIDNLDAEFETTITSTAKPCVAPNLKCLAPADAENYTYVNILHDRVNTSRKGREIISRRCLDQD